MRRVLFTAVTLLVYTVGPTFALHESEVGVVDWYKPLIGVPRVSSRLTAPVFHRLEHKGGTTSSLVFTATESNVLAALNPDNGNLTWRFVHEPADPIQSFRAEQHAISSLSGSGGAILRVFDAPTGALVLEKQMHSSASGRLLDPSVTGADLAYAHDGTRSLFVLGNGHEVRRVHIVTSQNIWEWNSPDQTSQHIYFSLFSTKETVYVVGLSKSFASYTLHVVTLDQATGAVISTADIPSDIKNGVEDVLVVSPRGSPVPSLIWLESGERLLRLELSPKLENVKSEKLSRSHYSFLQDVGLGRDGIFIAVTKKSQAQVFKFGKKGFETNSDFQHTAGGVYTAGRDNKGFPYVGSLSWSQSLNQASLHIHAPHLVDGQGLTSGLTFAFDTDSHGVINHIALDVSNPSPFSIVSRAVITTSTGAIQLWQGQQNVWTREESLSEIRAVEFVDLPLEEKAVLGEENFLQRIIRHALDARNLPAFLSNYITRFVTGSYETASSSVSTIQSTASLVRDAFGMRKVIVTATAGMKLIALDSGSGRILWSRLLDIGDAEGASLFPIRLFPMVTVADGAIPTLALVAQRRLSDGKLDVVVYHFNALTGVTVGGIEAPKLHCLKLFDGPLVETFFEKGSKTIVLVDSQLIVHPFPATEERLARFDRLARSLRFALPQRSSDDPSTRRLVGHQIAALRRPDDKTFQAFSTWTTAFAPGEDILEVIKPKRDLVASLGKVLGDRRTLYKYINPHLQVILTGSRTSCSVNVVDAAKGGIVYRANVPTSRGACDVKAILVENWLLYQYFAEANGRNTSSGYQVVSVELYEGTGPDDKTRSSEVSSDSPESALLHSYTQTYLFPHKITSIAATSTTHGISMKDIIVADGRNHVQAYNRRFFDPRRPKRKPTAEEQEEWLVQYDALIPDDTRRALSHNYEVANVKHILTSPALLESTSLVFAYGLDLFSTRVSPSGTFDLLSESFNKAQLVLTIFGLAAAIMVTRPIVRRKRLQANWYPS